MASQRQNDKLGESSSMPDNHHLNVRTPLMPSGPDFDAGSHLPLLYSYDATSPPLFLTPPVQKGEKLSIFHITALLSFSFYNGSVLSTLFLIVLPMECTSMANDGNESILLGWYLAAAGVAQLFCPVIGLCCDRCTHHPAGRRRPFLVAGTVGGLICLCSMIFASARGNEILWSLWGLEMTYWSIYGVAFFFYMIALNVSYYAIIGFIPDLIPKSQVGIANGIQAMLMVLGSLFGLVEFSTVLDREVGGVYILYVVLSVTVTVLTVAVAYDDLPPNTYMEMESDKEIRRWWRIRKYFDSISWEDVKESYWISPVEHRDFFFVTLSRTFYYMGISTQGFFLYFLHDIIKAQDPAEIVSLLAIVSQSAGTLTCIPIGIWSDKSGQRKQYVYASCFLLALGYFSFVMCTSVDQIFMLVLVLGAANGAYLTMDTSMAIDCLPDPDAAARFLGVWGVGSFVGTAMGPMVGGALLFFLGRCERDGHSNEIEDEQIYSRIGYMAVFFLAGIYFIASAYVLRGVKERKNVAIES